MDSTTTVQSVPRWNWSYGSADSRIGDGCEWGQRSRGASEFGVMHCCAGIDSAPDRIDAILDLLADDMDLTQDMGDREMRGFTYGLMTGRESRRSLEG